MITSVQIIINNSRLPAWEVFIISKYSIAIFMEMSHYGYYNASLELNNISMKITFDTKEPLICIIQISAKNELKARIEYVLW